MTDDTTNRETRVEHGTESGLSDNETPTSETEGDEGQGEQQTTADDAEEIDYEGSKYKVPKPLKDAFLRHSDYTKKTQEVAEQRRAHEAAVKEFQSRADIIGRYINETVQLRSMAPQLDLYDKIAPATWARWARESPAEAQAAQIEYNALSTIRDRLMRGISEKESQRRAAEAAESETLIAKAEQELRAKIKDWGPDKKQGLLKVAADYGFGNGELAQHDPRVWMALNDLAVYRASLAKAKATSDPAEARPVPKVGGPAHAAKDPAKMSMDEYARWMNRKERGRDAA
jgi:hypothetical protein